MSGTWTRRYQFKLYPTAAQAALLHEQRLMMAALWNALKQRIEDTYRREKRMLSFFDLTNEITELRHECPEWVAVPAVTAHRVAKVLTESYAAFFRRLKAGEDPGHPGWRSRRNASGIPLGTMCKTGWRIEQRTDNPKSWRLHYGSVTDVRKPETWIHARGSRYADTAREDQGKLHAVESWRNADILWRGNTWWLSVCVDRPGSPGKKREAWEKLRIEFDLLDCFARVNGSPHSAFATRHAEHIDALEDEIDQRKSERDQRWPRTKRRDDAEQADFVEANIEISRLYARVKRIRSNALHVWTSSIVRDASNITIVTPRLRENIRTPRGDERRWGAEVETVSLLNRHTLHQAPGIATAMLKYKAEEKGIRCDVVMEEAPNIAVGPDLVLSGKEQRRARRAVRRLEA